MWKCDTYKESKMQISWEKEVCVCFFFERDGEWQEIVSCFYWFYGQRRYYSDKLTLVRVLAF